MLRQWILNLVYAICFIPGVKNYADILTKPLALAPFARFRDAMLSAQIVLPSRSTSDQSDSYVSRLTQYVNYAMAQTNVLPACSAACWVCRDCDDDALSLPLSAGGGVKPCDSSCSPAESYMDYVCPAGSSAESRPGSSVSAGAET